MERYLGYLPAIIFIVSGFSLPVFWIRGSNRSYLLSQSENRIVFCKPRGQRFIWLAILAMLASQLFALSLEGGWSSIIFWLMCSPLIRLLLREAMPESFEFDLIEHRYRHVKGWAPRVLRSGAIASLVGIGIDRVMKEYGCCVYWNRYDSFVVGGYNDLDNAIALLKSLRDSLNMPINRRPNGDALPKMLV